MVCRLGHFTLVYRCDYDPRRFAADGEKVKGALKDLIILKNIIDKEQYESPDISFIEFETADNITVLSGTNDNDKEWSDIWD